MAVAKLGSMVLGLAFVVAAGTLPLVAQEPAKPKEAPKVKKGSGQQVPDYFGQVGLTADQRKQIYAIQAKHDDTIRALKKQLADAQAKVVEECETVLTETQKELLAQHRKAAAEAKKAARAKKNAAKEAPKESN